MLVTEKEIKQDIDELISKYDGHDEGVTLKDVYNQFPHIESAFGHKDAIFGSGNVAPTQETPMEGIAEFAAQYLDSHDIEALGETRDSVLATELHDFFLRKFPTALYGLFSGVAEVNRKYGGLDPDANQLSDEIIIPSFIDEATSAGANKLPTGFTGSFSQPAIDFSNTLTNTTSGSTTAIGWVNHYFTIDTTLSKGSLYKSPQDSPALDKTSAFIVFGALDRKGNVSGIKYSNAKGTQSKPVYVGHAGLKVGDASTSARVLDNGMSLYVGQSTSGYVGLDISDKVAAGNTVDVNTELLGHFFSIAPTIQNNLY